MNERFIESRKIIAGAREALKRGNMTEARQLAERAAELAPQSEDPWLILAVVASPRESVNYIRKALAANPNSPRAKKGMEWAMQRLGEKPKAETSHEITQPVQSAPKSGDSEASKIVTPTQSPSKGNIQRASKEPKKRGLTLPIL